MEKEMQKVFNYEKNDYANTPLLMGEDKGLLDTVHKRFPEIFDNYLTQKSLNWMFNEFDFSSCVQDFQNADRSTYDMMIKTLAWQWEADSVAATTIAPVLAPFITSSELWMAWLTVTDMEAIHGATYSEIVRNSFSDPTVIVDEILRVKEAHERLGRVVRVFNEAFEASHKYALGQIPNDQETYNKVFMFIVALYCMERIQFAASFAVTFAICDTGMFQPIGKAVQKIAQDELEVHSELDRLVLQYELQTERGKKALEMLGGEIQALVEEVVESEFAWVDYLFSEGRELVGISKDRLKGWTLYCAEEIFNVLGLDKTKYEFPEQNPLRFMDKWLNISKIQASPQEQDIAAYKMGVLQRDDEGVEFDVEF